MKVTTDITIQLNASDIVVFKRMLDIVNDFRKNSGGETITIKLTKPGKGGYMTIEDRFSFLEVARTYEDAAYSVLEKPDHACSEMARYIISSGVEHPTRTKAYNEKDVPGHK